MLKSDDIFKNLITATTLKDRYLMIENIMRQTSNVNVSAIATAANSIKAYSSANTKWLIENQKLFESAIKAAEYISPKK